MNKKIVIAVDGFASCGKSTLAKSLAKRFNFTYVDSGAMYRAVMLYFLDNNIDINDIELVKRGLEQVAITFELNKTTGLNEIFLNGKNVENEIRGMRISTRVSELSKIREVRGALVDIQRQIGRSKGIVMDGRDIGTVVFPQAELKLFMTADFEERVRRRYDEMISKGVKISKEEVAENLRQRDYIDTNRKESPLVKADDAIEIDNTDLTPEEQLDIAISYAGQKINPKIEGKNKPF